MHRRQVFKNKIKIGGGPRAIEASVDNGGLGGLHPRKEYNPRHSTVFVDKKFWVKRNFEK